MNTSDQSESRFHQRSGIKCFVCFVRFNAFHAESKKPLHRESGFIRIQPGTNNVAFIIAQNSGVDVDQYQIHRHYKNY